MSERYRVVTAGRRWFMIDRGGDNLMTRDGVADELNRLAAEVATLRELLRKAYSYAPIELASEIYAVIQPTMESL